MRVLLVAFAALGVGAAKRKAPLRQPDEMCSACWAVAVQARRALGFYVRRDRAPNAAEWKRAMVSGCPATAGIRERCEADLVGRYGEDLAFVLEDLYDEAEGDERFLNLGEVSAKLCSHESATGACPPEVHALRPVEAQIADEASAAGRGVKVALRNQWRGGVVEVHVIDREDPTACSASELELLKNGSSAAVRFVEPDVESRFFLAFLGPDGDPVLQPTLRVKPRGAPCGVGVDADVDFASPFTIFAVDAPEDSSALAVSRAWHENPRPELYSYHDAEL